MSFFAAVFFKGFGQILTAQLLIVYNASLHYWIKCFTGCVTIRPKLQLS